MLSIRTIFVLMTLHTAGTDCVTFLILSMKPIHLVTLIALSAHAESLTDNESLLFTGETRETAKAQLLRIPTAEPTITSSSRN